MMRHDFTYNKGRRFSIHMHSAYSRFLSLLLLTSYFTITSPAFLSCSGTLDEYTAAKEEVMTPLKFTAAAIRSQNSQMDIFIYNQDKLGRLDSYSTYSFSGDQVPQTVEIASRNGKKNVVVLVNWQSGEMDWSRLSSYENILKATSSLDDEDILRPRMSGNAVINAGTYPGIISLRTMMARIRLKKISCNLEGRTYKDRKFKNVKVYLTNVCTTCNLVPESSPGNTYINIGGLSQGDMSRFRATSLLFKEYDEPLGSGSVLPGYDFYCYPEDNSSAGPGRPQTKLVIQADMDGQTYYYPIEIGTYTAGAIKRNTSYDIDITLTRLGGSDPDTPLSPGYLNATINVLPWKEHETVNQNF